MKNVKTSKVSFAILPVLALIFGCIGCQTLTYDGLPSNPPGEYLKPVFDDRDWVMVNRRADDYKTLTEYSPQDQIDADWTESLGGTFFAEGHYISPIEDEYNNFIRGVRTVCSQVKDKIISQTYNELFYEWRISGCNTQPDQTEIGRYVLSNHGLYRIAYVRRGTILSPEDRKMWLALLSKAELRSIVDQ